MLEKEEGIVIRTMTYGESNVIVTLLTRGSGKIAVMARGAKKPKSRLASVSQLFVYGMFLYYKSSGMSTLTQGDAIDSFPRLRNDIYLTAYASYMVELVDKLTEERHRNPYLFELVWQLLHHVNEEADPEVLKQILEVKMTSLAGIKPVLDHCAKCHSTTNISHFSIREAGFLCQQCQYMDDRSIPLQPASARLLRLFYHIDLKRLGNIKVKDETKQEIKRVIDTYYDEYSGLFLKSKRFLDQLERWKI